ncbi:glycosyltransferase family 2 protein [Paracoccus suum]|uniref:Glycosyltransferase family 2 protein n=1 Tax=Paracoccus suum TaxID=2259340 RepID=A0A344PKN4_9RHOB|nr:glycosyltransferase family 2 protein [Paracoccus suum]AXC49939.1 glycosyltransferase family 2 protein [Paracoccus suum]
MQKCLLPPAEQLRISVDAPLSSTREIYFEDEAGRCLLAIMCRTDRRSAKGSTRLVISRFEASGEWGPEISVDLPEGRVPGPFELRIGAVELEIVSGERVLLSCDPSRAMGPETVAHNMRILKTNCDLRAFSLQIGTEVAAQLALADRIAQTAPEADDALPGATLIMLSSAASMNDNRREAVQLDAHFAQVVVLDPAAEGEDAIDRSIDAAIAAVETSNVMVVSGEWTAADLSSIAAGYLLEDSDNVYMPLGFDMVVQPGTRWGMMLPARFRGRPSLRAVAGMVTVDPAFLALADWRAPSGWKVGPQLRAARNASARLPFEVDPGGATQLQLARPTRHPLVVTPPAMPQHALFAAGLRHMPLSRGFPQSVRQMLLTLASQADENCADDLVLCALTGEDLAHTVADAFRHPLSGIETVTEAGRPIALRLSPAVLADLMSPGFVRLAGPDSRRLLDAPQPDLPAMITTIVGMLSVAGVPVIDSIPSVPKAADSDDSDAPVDLIWCLPDAVLAEMVQRASTPSAAVAVRGVHRLCPSPATFAQLALQCAARQQLPFFEVASNLDLIDPKGDHVRRMVSQLERSGLLRDGDVLAGLVAMLVRRRYFDEVRKLVAAPVENAPPLTLLALRTAEIAASVFDPADTRFAGIPPESLLPDDLPRGASLAAFGEALTHYRAVRRDWPGVLATVDLVGNENLTNFSYEHWMMARIGAGQTKDTAEMIHRGRAGWRLHEWSYRRLLMQLAYRTGDPDQVRTAVADMLANDPEMAPLTAAPTVFTKLNGTPGIDLDEVACVIVARNEFGRLKWLHQYYRDLGIAQFVLVDNMSDDQTVAYFTAQPDVFVLQTDENYRDSRYGVKWHNEVCETYFRDRWVLTVDADEVLVFAGSDQPGAINDLVRRLDAGGDEAFLAPMIDMYADGALDQVDFQPGDSLIENFPLFDGTGYWFDRTASFPDTTVSGGVRIRRFWNDRHDPRLPHLSMQKAPLARWNEGFHYLSSTHEMTPCRVSSETGALLHFKFLPDFHARAMEEVRRNQHYEGAREYRVYAEILEDPANRSFRYPGSLQYEGPQTLIDAGLIVPPKTARAAGGRR